MMNVAVVGYGYWGPNLVRNFMETPDVKVTMVADLDTARLARAQRRYPGLRTPTNFNDALNDPAVDAVVIATPVSTHFELGMAALRAGKHLWLEKPMAETSLQARRLTDEADKRDLVLLVDHTFLYTGAIRKISELMRSGSLGSLYYYDSTRINLGLFQKDVCVIADLAVHDFSILLHMLDERPLAVSASGMSHFSGSPENLAYVTLFYGSGLIAHVNVSWLSPVKIRQILVGGSEKMIVYDDLEASEKIKIYDSGVRFTSDADRIQEMRVGYRTGDMWSPQVPVTEALRIESEHFVDSIRNKRRPMTDGELGTQVVELIEVAISSMRGKGETIHLRQRERAA